jgi:hypothetical protein
MAHTQSWKFDYLHSIPASLLICVGSGQILIVHAALLFILLQTGNRIARNP